MLVDEIFFFGDNGIVSDTVRLTHSYFIRYPLGRSIAEVASGGDGIIYNLLSFFLSF